MSKTAEEAAMKVYPYGGGTKGLICENARPIFIKGYEQAEKDIIYRIREQIERWIPDNPEGDEHISGERVAFRSVLNLLNEMEEEL